MGGSCTSHKTCNIDILAEMQNWPFVFGCFGLRNAILIAKLFGVHAQEIYYI